MNTWIGIGRATKDCELTTTPNGTNVARFTIAVDRRFKDQDGNKVADFISVIAWRGLADICHKFIKKGSMLAVNGELQIRTYEAQDGSKRYVAEIIADNVQFINMPKNETEEKPVETKPSILTPVDDDNLPF